MARKRNSVIEVLETKLPEPELKDKGFRLGYLNPKIVEMSGYGDFEPLKKEDKEQLVKQELCRVDSEGHLTHKGMILAKIPVDVAKKDRERINRHTEYVLNARKIEREELGKEFGVESIDSTVIHN